MHNKQLIERSGTKMISVQEEKKKIKNTKIYT